MSDASPTLVSAIGLGISVLALALSTTTAWLTLFRRGQLSMTRPTVIYFGPDGSRHGLDPNSQKIFFRSLIYSTGKRGIIIENMFIRLKRGESTQNFNIWVHGDDKLKRGSGLFVSDTGVETNHHFLPPADIGYFEFKPGKYLIDVLVKAVGHNKIIDLFSISVEITADESAAIKDRGCGVYFDWGPDTNEYNTRVEPPPKTPPLPAGGLLPDR